MRGVLAHAAWPQAVNKDTQPVTSLRRRINSLDPNLDVAMLFSARCEFDRDLIG